jgi:glycosyltransferase involved in cell wall biosynthesis
LISTKQEADFGKAGVQFLHHEPDGRTGKTYLQMLSLIGRKKKGIELNTTIVPSLYIKSMYDAVYENKADVVYPAIRKTEKGGKWTARTDGFLFIGRIEEEKNIELAIEVLSELITVHGMDIHLHIIGTGKGEYYNKIKEMASKSSWIYMEGFVSPSEYFKLISSHKYGINTRINEPSAVTPREMIDGGMIAFLHKSGGNREIVNGNDSVLFDTKERAVEQIKKVINDEKLQNEILDELRKLHFNSRAECMQQILSKIRSKNISI